MVTLYHKPVEVQLLWVLFEHTPIPPKPIPSKTYYDLSLICDIILETGSCGTRGSKCYNLGCLIPEIYILTRLHIGFKFPIIGKCWYTCVSPYAFAISVVINIGE